MYPNDGKELFSGIRSILLDVDDTILDFGKCASASMRAAARTAGITFPDGMENIFHRINDSLWKKVEKGELTVAGLYEVRWELIFADTGIDCDGAAFEALFRKELSESTEPVSGAGELLKYLAGRGYALFSASNALQHQQKKRLAKAGFLEYFSGIFTSESLGAQKPSREFFERAVSLCGAGDRDRCLMIGDSFEADIKGAAAFGIRTIWFDRKGAAGEHPLAATRVVTKLEDIMTLL